MLQDNKLHVPQLLSLSSRAWEPQQERGLHATTGEDPAHRSEDPAQPKVQTKQNTENDTKV